MQVPWLSQNFEHRYLVGQTKPKALSPVNNVCAGRKIFSHYQTICRIRDKSLKILISTYLRFLDQFQSINVSVYIVEITNNKARFIVGAVY